MKTLRSSKKNNSQKNAKLKKSPPNGKIKLLLYYYHRETLGNKMSNHTTETKKSWAWGTSRKNRDPRDRQTR